MKKITFLSLFLCYTAAFAGYNEGKEIFEKKCAQCHTGYVDFNTIKINFFKYDNKLLNLKAPTVNMIEYAIMRSPKKIGDPADKEMRQVEIEEFLKEVMVNPDIENTICDPITVKHFKAKTPNQIKISDDEAIELSYFFMEYKENIQKEYPKKEKITSKDLNEEELLKQAQSTNRLIMIEVSSKNCYFCKKMKEEVIDLEDVQKAINKNYIFHEIMIEDTKLPFNLEKHFQEMTPTFFVISKEGKLLKSYPGAWKKEDFLNNLKENLQ